MTLHIAAVGDWTRSLYQLVKQGQDEQVCSLTHESLSCASVPQQPIWAPLRVLLSCNPMGLR